MTNVAVIGAQWGDEGKGKIVDWLSSRADVVVRFQGGHNAGHTLVIGGVEYKLSLLPSGIVRPGKLSVIGNGVVIDPWHLIKEIALLRSQGAEISPDTLVVSDTAALILPLHQAVDHARTASVIAKNGPCRKPRDSSMAVARGRRPISQNAACRRGPPASAREARPSQRHRSARRSRQGRWPRRRPPCGPDGRSRY